MKIKYTLIAVILGIPLAVGSGYYLAYPKVVVSNLSEMNYEEFVVYLPSSRISFSPVSSGDSNTILYSRQKQPGVGSYSLKNKSTEVFEGSFPYPEGSEIGRVLLFIIESDGQASFARQVLSKGAA